ncbi:hypothetical protein [Pseudomonas oryzihabitans]|uniref:hypothetical protein n=1 Tax=Pseudomonas oryzihabitans TaxID=47885 RepID=UPI00241F3441|nr:hypothetical protein [Pseudomonas oryzihabitans]
MTILVQQLRAEIERLQAENSSLRDALADKVVDSTKLRAFLPADGGFTIGLEGGPCALLADAFGEQLYTSDAINYLQLTFTSGAYPDLGQIVVTLQRCTGKTPHELRIYGEQERDQLKAEKAELLGALQETNHCLVACLTGGEVSAKRAGKAIEAAAIVIEQAMTKEQQT